MSWLVVKHVSKKIWLWIKHHWYIPLLVVYSLVLFVVFRKDGLSALEILYTTKDSYAKQIKAVNEAHEEELAKRNDILKKYNTIVDDIDAQHEVDKRKLDSHKKKMIKDLVENYHEDPEELTRMLKITFGINYESG